MHPHTTQSSGFKRQVVFRVGPEDWAILETAAAEHGSIQAAVLAGIRGLVEPLQTHRPKAPSVVAPIAVSTPSEPSDPEALMTAREAAKLLGLKSATIRGYIRSGRLSGWYDDRRGWLTTRGEIEAYARR